MKVKSSILSHLITSQQTVWRYRQMMMTKYRVPTFSAWILSNQWNLVSRDLAKKVNIDHQSASSLSIVIHQLLLRFYVIIGTSASHNPRWILKQLLESFYALPFYLWHKDTGLIGCLRYRDCVVIRQQTPWIIDTSQSMKIGSSKCLRINNSLSRDIWLIIKVILTRLSVSSYMILVRLIR